MQISLKDKKTEAIKRMKLLRLFEPVIKQFEESDLVNISEPPFGAHFWLNDEDKARVKDFEKKNNALVFTAIRSYTGIGKMDSYLFVSDYLEEWEMDRRGFKNNQAFVWTFNHDVPDFSEFENIGIVPTPAAGLRRTW